MRIKSYFAESMRAAMQHARAELGPEALLLNSKTTAQVGSATAYEVTFGVANNARAEVPMHLGNAVSSGDVARELAELRQQLESVQKSLTTAPQPVSAKRGTPRAKMTDLLISAGFSRAFTQQIADAALARIPHQSGNGVDSQLNTKSSRPSTAIPPDCLRNALLDEIEARFSVSPSLGSAHDEQKAVLLVGPPGAGKTTTLVKLAIVYGAARNLPVQILSTDTLRLGGAEQLQAYSRIVGAGFRAVTGRKAIEDACHEFRSKKLILIDTAGFGRADIEEARDLSAFAEQRSHLDIHLVLPATLHASAMFSILQRFRIFRPSKLIFTHMDEVESPVCMLEAAIRSGLAISFVTNGQQIPEDLAEASKPDLRLKLAARLKERVSAAA